MRRKTRTKRKGRKRKINTKKDRNEKRRKTR